MTRIYLQWYPTLRVFPKYVIERQSTCEKYDAPQSAAVVYHVSTPERHTAMYQAHRNATVTCRNHSGSTRPLLHTLVAVVSVPGTPDTLPTGVLSSALGMGFAAGVDSVLEVAGGLVVLDVAAVVAAVLVELG